MQVRHNMRLRLAAAITVSIGSIALVGGSTDATNPAIERHVRLHLHTPCPQGQSGCGPDVILSGRNVAGGRVTYR